MAPQRWQPSPPPSLVAQSLGQARRATPWGRQGQPSGWVPSLCRLRQWTSSCPLLTVMPGVPSGCCQTRSPDRLLPARWMEPTLGSCGSSCLLALQLGAGPAPGSQTGSEVGHSLCGGSGRHLGPCRVAGYPESHTARCPALGGHLASAAPVPHLPCRLPSQGCSQALGSPWRPHSLGVLSKTGGAKSYVSCVPRRQPASSAGRTEPPTAPRTGVTRAPSREGEL